MMFEFVQSGAESRIRTSFTRGRAALATLTRFNLLRDPIEEFLRILRQFHLDWINSLRTSQRLG